MVTADAGQDGEDQQVHQHHTPSDRGNGEEEETAKVTRHTKEDDSEARRVL